MKELRVSRIITEDLMTLARDPKGALYLEYRSAVAELGGVPDEIQIVLRKRVPDDAAVQQRPDDGG